MQYIVAIDIGVASVGYAVIDKNVRNCNRSRIKYFPGGICNR